MEASTLHARTEKPGPAPHHRGALPWRQARDLAADLPQRLGAQRMPLAQAAGRVLAADVRSALMLPGADTAAMDGYAVAGAGPWRLVGAPLLAGGQGMTRLVAGDAAEIATGAVVPPGANRVVPYEQCVCDGQTVTAVVEGKANIRRAGEDLLAGDVLAVAGTTVRAAVIGAAAHAGVDEVLVRHRPRVLLVVTGDELVDCGLPQPGQVRDALGPLVNAFVHHAGADVVRACHVRDERSTLAEALSGGGWDVAVVTGSSSVGRADHLRAVLGTAGAELVVDGVACRPGHPQLLARMANRGRWVVGLPGNPYAGLVGCLTLLEPLLGALSGRTPRPALMLPLLGDARPGLGITRLVPVRLAGAHARVVDGARPASLAAAAGADAVAVVDQDWIAGQPVELLPLP
ncbi:molybdopterin molybdenumtransferase MoeA [Catellatospora sp. TT07R-123]|uniref:molybdopterin molybdotransferase MoeA n=1 Tax=Catellatospora sp. TT07R-123 TaxID=2733863 RepID=UPI001B118E40|nr:molybdopterin molybdotransferase MoeA [Catellatospora sp. TT07R-123]GHJ43375.1 molybdopterin molybdenumtransferase MoeA [Catellatospora sp. TT07R-123]